MNIFELRKDTMKILWLLAPFFSDAALVAYSGYGEDPCDPTVPCGRASGTCEVSGVASIDTGFFKDGTECYVKIGMPCDPYEACDANGCYQVYQNPEYLQGEVSLMGNMYACVAPPCSPYNGCSSSNIPGEPCDPARTCDINGCYQWYNIYTGTDIGSYNIGRIEVTDDLAYKCSYEQADGLKIYLEFFFVFNSQAIIGNTYDQ